MLPARVAAVAQMISDPCTAPLTDKAYGGVEGYVARFKNVTIPAETTTSGYILFNPYSMSGFGGFYYTNISTSSGPTNTVAFPMGSGPANSTGVSVTQAGDGFVNTSTCQSARTLAACVRCVYTGNTSNARGRLAFLENIDPALLLTLPGTDQLFAFASKVERVSLDPMEVTYRPSEDFDDRFKPAGVATIALGTAGVSATTITVEGRELSPKWIGFAWTGMASNELVFETYRVLEWKPDLGVGITNNNQDTVSNGEPVVNKALAFLDSSVPGWSTTLMNVASSGASLMANAALGGMGLPQMPMRASPLRIMY